MKTWSADIYSNNAGFVPAYGSEILSWLKPLPNETILDLGCGDGVLTKDIVATGAQVLGIDSSENLLEAARAKGLNVQLMNGESITLPQTYDAVFSNAALHWMTQPDRVARGVYSVLKPGGRFVAEFGGAGNVAAIVTALLAALAELNIDGRARIPWYFPTVKEHRDLLHSCGFDVREMVLVPRPTPLPTGLRGWLKTFADPFVDGLEQDQVQHILDRVVYLLEPSLMDTQGEWQADYVRLRFSAIRPA
ncbi:MAG: class I SAM-dependent methyltransferase [Gammaproteobacteria bacterium]|nr:class I SAM-dependent methyltransferase [Gammaproteobacteria bacterium]